MVVSLQGRKIIGGSIASRVKHVQRVNYDKSDVFLFDQVSILAYEVIPALAPVVLILHHEDITQYLLRKLLFTKSGGFHSYLGHSTTKVVSAKFRRVIKTFLGNHKSNWHSGQRNLRKSSETGSCFAFARWASQSDCATLWNSTE